jgi:heparosan-N-sulfate-glucuronate 5-epimerase
MMRRLNYWRRVVSAYLLGGRSQLSFWHENPVENPRATPERLGEYYMTFHEKADYAGPFDEKGVPLLDYRGSLGKQHNPIAIAQFGLGNYNLFKQTGERARRERFELVANWLVDNLERNAAGLWVWHHHFDWEYRDTLKAPWYSGLAQGQGISVLVRAFQETHDEKYLSAAQYALQSIFVETRAGGVLFTDSSGYKWLEEYIVSPPTHILNGFVWGLWGIYDYWLCTGDEQAQQMFGELVTTLIARLPTYDTGYWSLYEHSGTVLPMLASRFYHSLHIVQLSVMYRLTGKPLFLEFQRRWEAYRARRINRARAWAGKATFKLVKY